MYTNPMDKMYADVDGELSARVASGRYGSREELLEDALGALDERDRIEDLLLHALRSGEPIEVAPGFWDEEKRLLLERRANRG